MSQASDSVLGILETHVSRQHGATTLTLAGELDLAAVEGVRASLTEAYSEGPSRVVIDLRELTFIDSTGISFLLSAVKEDEEGRLSFIGCDAPAVLRVFAVTGVADLFGG